MLSGLGSCGAAAQGATEAALPEVSRQFIAEYFPGAEVSFAKGRDGVPRQGVQGGAGRRHEARIQPQGGPGARLSAGTTPFPRHLFPEPVRAYVARQFAGHRITCIERDRRDFEVELDNGFES